MYRSKKITRLHCSEENRWRVSKPIPYAAKYFFAFVRVHPLTPLISNEVIFAKCLVSNADGSEKIATLYSLFQSNEYGNWAFRLLEGTASIRLLDIGFTDIGKSRRNPG
jgi:hypothetical protein